MIDTNGLLMIEPQRPASATPVIDEMTRKMTAAYRQSTPSQHGYRGVHVCKCGAMSDNRDHYVNGVLTNSLAVHYLAHHRDEVPETELEKVRNLKFGEAEPTEQELSGGGFRRSEGSSTMRGGRFRGTDNFR